MQKLENVKTKVIRISANDSRVSAGRVGSTTVFLKSRILDEGI